VILLKSAIPTYYNKKIASLLRKASERASFGKPPEKAFPGVSGELPGLIGSKNI
jgi:hypothetical protein